MVDNGEKAVLRQAQLEKALAQMAEFMALPASHKGRREALIQCFEYTTELLWKTLKLFLEQQGVYVSSPRLILKEAFQQGLLRRDEKLWLNMIEDRNLTVHSYNEKLANEIAARIPEYHAAVAECLSIIKSKEGL